MGVRAGTSWRTGPGRRSWVSAPAWALPLLVPLAVVAAVLLGAAWVVIKLVHLGVLGIKTLRERHAVARRA